MAKSYRESSSFGKEARRIGLRVKGELRPFKLSIGNGDGSTELR